MKKILSLSIVGLLTSCGAIINGSHQDVMINANVQGATVNVDGQQMGQTPLKTDLSRSSSHLVQVSAPGYETATVQVERDASWWLLGSAVCGGLIGIGIDFVNGGAWELDAGDVKNIQLIKKGR